MAIELITAPTGGAPLTTGDYDAQNNYLAGCMLSVAGFNVHLTEWTTLVVPALAEGTYIWHGGALFQVRDSNYAIGGAPANGTTYIKVARSGDELTATFVNAIAGYAWNYVYNGLYHADDSQILPYVLNKNIANYQKYAIIFKNTDWTTDIKVIDGITIEADNENLSIGANGATDFKMFFNGSNIYLDCSGTINLRPSSDVDDYIVFGTSGNIPYIGTSGACGLKITSSSGEINFDNENLTTTGNITGIHVISPAISSGTQAIAALGTWKPTAGLYNFVAANDNIKMEIFVGGSWRQSDNPSTTKIWGAVLCDGTNVRFANIDAVNPFNIYYQKFTRIT